MDINPQSGRENARTKNSPKLIVKEEKLLGGSSGKKQKNHRMPHTLALFILFCVCFCVSLHWKYNIHEKKQRKNYFKLALSKPRQRSHAIYFLFCRVLRSQRSLLNVYMDMCVRRSIATKATNKRKVTTTRERKEREPRNRIHDTHTHKFKGYEF